MPDTKKKADAAPPDPREIQGLPFLILLTLTAQGRNVAEHVADDLAAAEKQLEDLGGKVCQMGMTFGHYDGFIAGDSPNQNALTNFVAFVNEQGDFSTETLFGVTRDPYDAGHH